MMSLLFRVTSKTSAPSKMLSVMMVMLTHRSESWLLGTLNVMPETPIKSSGAAEKHSVHTETCGLSLRGAQEL